MALAIPSNIAVTHVFRTKFFVAGSNVELERPAGAVYQATRAHNVPALASQPD